MTAEDLYKIQAALEGLCFNHSGHLIRFKDMPGEFGPPSRVVALDLGSDRRLYFGCGIAPDLELELSGLAPDDVYRGTPYVLGLLYPSDGDARRAEYWTYSCSLTDLPPTSPSVQTLSSTDGRLGVISNGFFGNPYKHVMAVAHEGKVESAAASAREDDFSAELWVYTIPEARRQGLARLVAATWLRDIIERGLIPFYSHAADNEESRRLAESLHLRLSFKVSCYP